MISSNQEPIPSIKLSLMVLLSVPHAVEIVPVMMLITWPSVPSIIISSSKMDNVQVVLQRMLIVVTVPPIPSVDSNALTVNPDTSQIQLENVLLVPPDVSPVL